MAGVFITFEGGEGTGKSTQVRMLASALEQRGFNLCITREPGGTPQGEALRHLLVTGEPGRWSATAEALLNNAAREAHLAGVIRPALAAGQSVICDRFMDSTMAYQGYAGGCDTAFLRQLQEVVVGETVPDLTLVFDLDPEVGLARAKARNDGSEDRFERKGPAFHALLRQGFLTIARDNPARCRVIDAAQPVDNVHAQVLAACAGVLRV